MKPPIIQKPAAVGNYGVGRRNRISRISLGETSEFITNTILYMRAVLRHWLTLFYEIPKNWMPRIAKMRFVVSYMGRLIYKLKVFNSVVILFAINMMHVFTSAEFAPKILLHYFPMNKLFRLIVTDIAHFSDVNTTMFSRHLRKITPPTPNGGSQFYFTTALRAYPLHIGLLYHINREEHYAKA